MKLVASPCVIRVWMPLGLVAGISLFLDGMAPEYWVLGLPVLLVAIFTSTLADVSDRGHRILVRTVWRSLDIPKNSVVKTAPSFLKGIGVLKLRSYVFPWGRVYFVADWSKFGAASPEEPGVGNQSKPSLWLAWLASLAMGVSGFLMGFGVRSNTRGFRVEPTMRLWAFILVGLLAVVFAFVRTRKPSFANVVLFAATGIIGFVRW